MIVHDSWNYHQYSILKLCAWLPSLWTGVRLRLTSLWYKPCCFFKSGHEIVPNTGTNAPKFFTLATKSWKLVVKLATRTFHHNLTKRCSELKRFAKINLRQTSSFGLFPKRSTCISMAQGRFTTKSFHCMLFRCNTSQFATHTKSICYTS